MNRLTTRMAARPVVALVAVASAPRYALNPCGKPEPAGLSVPWLREELHQHEPQTTDTGARSDSRQSRQELHLNQFFHLLAVAGPWSSRTSSRVRCESMEVRATGQRLIVSMLLCLSQHVEACFHPPDSLPHDNSTAHELLSLVSIAYVVTGISIGSYRPVGRLQAAHAHALCPTTSPCSRACSPALAQHRTRMRRALHSASYCEGAGRLCDT